MTISYVLVKLVDNKDMVVNGVFSSLEAAMIYCLDEYEAVVEFVTDKSYENTTEFKVYTVNNPQGILAQGIK